MANENWSKWGEDIKKTVQSSVESHDFSNLNESVGRIVDSAIQNVNDTLKTTQWDNHSQKGSGSARYRDSVRENIKSVKNNIKKATSSIPRLYGQTGPDLGIGITMMVFGLLGVFGFAGGLLVTGIVTAISGMFHAGIIAGMSIMGILFAGSIVLAAKGSGKIALVNRFQRYVKEIGNKMYCSVPDLAQKTGKNVNYVKKDLSAMIRKGYFLQGHLDDQGNCLMVSEESYNQYRQAQAQYLEREKRNQLHAVQNAGLPENVRQIIAEGEQFVEKIRRSNDAIPGIEISNKISRMEHIVQKIFQRVKARPELVGELKQLMGYYLPTTVKLLDAYEDLDAQPVQGPNINSSKKEIEDTMDTLNTAFENLLDGFYQETAWDISSDISVLETMLAQEGLTKSDFEKVKNM